MNKQKLRFGATLMTVGGLLAALGEIVNTRTGDVFSSAWHLSLGLIVIGTLILLVGLPTFASLSEQIGGFGFVGSNLLILGGLILIIGTVALDWVIVPFLINLANTMATTINEPAAKAQHDLNAIISSLNSLGGSIFHISAVNIPRVDGTAMVNKVLVQLHVPTLDRIEWWAHFCLSGGTLIVGSLILGLALPRTNSTPIPTGALLIIFAILNLLCQIFTPIPSFFGNITCAVLFLTLGWLGVSAWSSKRVEVKE
jgi:hypothetical protein